jgi:hypothetical protein
MVKYLIKIKICHRAVTPRHALVLPDDGYITAAFFEAAVLK